MTFFVQDDFIDKKEKQEGKKLLKTLGQKFINLQNLEIEFEYDCDQVSLLFCHYLKEIIDKNDVVIQLKFDSNLDNDEFNKVIKWIKQVNIRSRARKLSFKLGYRETFGSVKKLLTLCVVNVEWITFSNDHLTNNKVASLAHFINQTTFKSLKVLEFIGFKFSLSIIEAMSKVLEMVTDKLKKRKLYFIASFKIDYSPGIDSLFDTFFQKLFNLMIKCQIPIDISLTMESVPYESKCNKIPQCDKYCVPLVTPTVSITWDDIKNCSEFVVKSARKRGQFSSYDTNKK